MSNIQIFNNPDFGTVRTLEEENGAIMFCGKDVAMALGYKSPKDAISAHCKGGGETPPPHQQRRTGHDFHP